MGAQKSKEILSELRERFIDGEKLSVDVIVSDYFAPKTPYSYLVGKTRVRGWLNLVKRQFKLRHGLWFGNLNDEGAFGIITAEEEVRYALGRYYRYVKGTVAGASLLVSDAGAKGLLPEGVRRERILVAKIEEEEDD